MPESNHQLVTPKHDADRSESTPETFFQKEISRKAARKLKRRQDRGIMFWLGMFGLVGWSVAVPTLGGIVLGNWLDAHWPASFSWTLTLLFTGVLLGCLNAWYWIKQEHHDN